MRQLLLKLLAIYQKFFTLIGFGSCRYYPTCSEYAKWQFEKNNLFVALYHSTLRILRCNQLFPGGIDYPVVPCKHNISVFKKIDVTLWLVPKGKSHCYMIKPFKPKESL